MASRSTRGQAEHADVSVQRKTKTLEGGGGALQQRKLAKIKRRLNRQKTPEGQRSA